MDITNCELAAVNRQLAGVNQRLDESNQRLAEANKKLDDLNRRTEVLERDVRELLPTLIKPSPADPPPINFPSAYIPPHRQGGEVQFVQHLNEIDRGHVMGQQQLADPRYRP